MVPEVTDESGITAEVSIHIIKRIQEKTNLNGRITEENSSLIKREIVNDCENEHKFWAYE